MHILYDAIGPLVSIVGFVTWAVWYVTRDQAATTRHCRHCRLPIPRAAAVCPHCTRSLSLWRRLRDGR